MRTAHLRRQYVLQWPSPYVSEVNKFGQVSSDGYHTRCQWQGIGDLCSGVPFLEGGLLYSEVQCIMGNGHMGTPHPVDGMTDG